MSVYITCSALQSTAVLFEGTIRSSYNPKVLHVAEEKELLGFLPDASQAAAPAEFAAAGRAVVLSA
jgi:hypothetical protein